MKIKKWAKFQKVSFFPQKINILREKYVKSKNKNGDKNDRFARRHLITSMMKNDNIEKNDNIYFKVSSNERASV